MERSTIYTWENPPLYSWAIFNSYVWHNQRVDGMLPGLVNVDKKTMERSTMLLMGKSTISTGPFSIAFCKRLPEGIFHEVDYNPIKPHEIPIKPH